MYDHAEELAALCVFYDVFVLTYLSLALWHHYGRKKAPPKRG